MAKVMRWRQLILICGVVLVAFFVAQSRISAVTADTRDEQNRLQVTLTALQNRNSELQAELDEIGTDNYIENRARTDYQFLKPGELRFEIDNPNALYGYTEAELRILAEENGA